MTDWSKPWRRCVCSAGNTRAAADVNAVVFCSRRLGPSRQARLERGVRAALLLAALGCRLEGDALDPTSPPEADSAAHAAGLAFATDSPSPAAPGEPRIALASLSRNALWAAWNSLRGDAYALDDVERWIAPPARIACRPEALVTHSGQVLPYHGAVRVAPAFRERLVRFEQLVIDVAEEVYGRAPARLQHFGAYSCRSTRQRAQRMSEHALGNAIDVIGFDFARAPRGRPLAPGLPKTLAQPFQVRVARHWAPRDASGSAGVHARFLHALAERLGDRSDVFRGMIGPSRRDHADHFHFDMSPWRYVWF